MLSGILYAVCACTFLDFSALIKQAFVKTLLNDLLRLPLFMRLDGVRSLGSWKIFFRFSADGLSFSSKSYVSPALMGFYLKAVLDSSEEE